MRRRLPFLVLALGLLIVAASLRPPSNAGAYDLAGFGRLPVLANGRVKPLDTVARTTLLVLQGRQRVVHPTHGTLTPEEWLLDVFFRPERSDDARVFEILQPDLLALLSLTPELGDGGKRFSYHQLASHLMEIDRQAQLADPVASAVRTPFQQAVVRLRNNIGLYQRLQDTFVPPQADEFFRLVDPAARGQAPATKPSPALVASLTRMNAVALLLPLPTHPTAGWTNAGSAFGAALASGEFNPAAAAYADLGRAWRAQNASAFNAQVDTLLALPGYPLVAPSTRTWVEVMFNASQPFYTSAGLNVLAMLLGIFSWLAWPDSLGRAARWTLALAFVLTTVGIAVRMWLEGRPPVTNLYSSALFVGWGATALCLLMERRGGQNVGSVAGGAVGFGTLVIAHHLALGGDTLEMMRAVLDSNFWLATHVVVITIGYSAMFLAGFLAIVYVLRGLFTRSLDPKSAAGLARMVYGIVCFATLFSFAGTVLGGIWADQSWGRFWGWDPKENGALVIVLWCAVILHARWGGLVRERGLMALAIGGNIITAWSWFGVNMLGVGLHSYGFMDAAFWWLVFFVVSQGALIGLACLPETWWRSLAKPAEPSPVKRGPHLRSAKSARASA